jgi:hypothetical protein
MHQHADKRAGFGGAELEADQRGKKIQQLQAYENLYDSHFVLHE